MKCILDIQIACEGRVELDEDTKKNSLEVHVEYVGDIHLGFAIQTFEEAVRAVREMFTKQTKSTATSVLVHLLPLTVLDSGASRFVAQIEHLGCLERNLRKHPRLRDVLRELTDHRGPQHFRKLSENIADVLSKLGSKSAEFVSMAMGQVRELKSGAGSEQVLFELIRGMWNSPFNPSYLGAWVTDIYQIRCGTIWVNASCQGCCRSSTRDQPTPTML